MTDTFKKGDKVKILNTTFGGQIIVEGEATVLSGPDDIENYKVRFPNGDVVERWIDPAAQDDPAGYVEMLNESTGRGPAKQEA